MSELNKENKKSTAGKVPVWVFVLVLVALLGGAYMLSEQRMATTDDENRTEPEMTSLQEEKSPKMREGNPVVAVVNGAEIKRQAVLDFIKTLPDHVKSMPIENLFPMALDQVVTDHILAQKVETANLDGDPEVIDALAQVEKEIKRNIFLQRQLDDLVTEDKLKAKYEEFTKQFDGVEETHARHILLESEDDAKAVIAELDEGADFVELAKEKSVGPTAERGGDLGYFKKGDMVAEFGEAAFALPVGEYSTEPVKSQFGWHVLMVEDRRNIEPPAYEEVRSKLEQKMRQEELFLLMQSWQKGADVEKFDINGGSLEVEYTPDEDASTDTAEQTVEETAEESAAEVSKPAETPEAAE